MSIKRWIARKLYPQAFQDAERYRYLRDRLSELQDWCGNECPEIDHAVVWAKKSVRVHFMPLAEYDEKIADGSWPSISVGDIHRFREDLRRRSRLAA